MININAKDDGFCIPVVPFQKFGNLLCHCCSPLIDNQILVVIFDVINSVLYGVSILICFSIFWAPSFIIHIQPNPDHSIRCKEPVVNALLERIGVNRVAKIFGVADLTGFAWRCSKSDMGSFMEVVEYFMPC